MEGGPSPLAPGRKSSDEPNPRARPDPKRQGRLLWAGSVLLLAPVAGIGCPAVLPVRTRPPRRCSGAGCVRGSPRGCWSTCSIAAATWRTRPAPPHSVRCQAGGGPPTPGSRDLLLNTLAPRTQPDPLAHHRPAVWVGAGGDERLAGQRRPPAPPPTAARDTIGSPDLAERTTPPPCGSGCTWAPHHALPAGPHALAVRSAALQTLSLILPGRSHRPLRRLITQHCRRHPHPNPAPDFSGNHKPRQPAPAILLTLLHQICLRAPAIPHDQRRPVTSPDESVPGPPRGAPHRGDHRREQRSAAARHGARGRDHPAPPPRLTSSALATALAQTGWPVSRRTATRLLSRPHPRDTAPPVAPTGWPARNTPQDHDRPTDRWLGAQGP